MNIHQMLAITLFSLPFFGVVVGMVRILGWLDALIIILTAMFLTTCLIFGIYYYAEASNFRIECSIESYQGTE